MPSCRGHWASKSLLLGPRDSNDGVPITNSKIGEAAGSRGGLRPEFGRAALLFGSAYDEIDRAGDAMKQYQAALELNPDNYRANLLLGSMFAMQDRPKEALPLLQRAVKLEPQSADAFKFLGNVYTVLGEEEKARHEEAEAQRLQSDGRTLKR